MEPDEEHKFKQIQKIFMIDKVKKQNVWTPEEDEKLIELVTIYSSKNWKEISKNFINKSSIQCYSRYKQIKPGLKKGPWTEEEDRQVKELVEIHGQHWSLISNIIKSRNGKQIRDRYLNYIDPFTKHNEFTEDEDELIKKLYIKHGSRWSYIASHCNGRTGDLVKNRFYSHIKKKVLITNPPARKKPKMVRTKLINNNGFLEPMRKERRSITSKFKQEEDSENLDIEGLRITEGNNEPEVLIVNSIPSIPSSDKCAAQMFNTNFFDDDIKVIDEVIKEKESSIFSDRSSFNSDRELSHNASAFYSLDNDPFDYSSSSNGSSQDFDIKSQNYFI